MSKSAWGKAVDNLFNGQSHVSFASLAEASSLDKQFEQKRAESFNLNGLKIEPKEKINPREYVPKTNDDSPCQRTIKRQEQLKAKWKIDGLQLEGQTRVEALSDSERCERFNSKANNRVTKLDYVLTR